MWCIVRVLHLRRIAYWHAYASSYSLLSRVALGHLGKGWIVRGTTTRILPYWATRLFYPSWNGCTNLQLIGSSVTDCQALT